VFPERLIDAAIDRFRIEHRRPHIHGIRVRIRVIVHYAWHSHTRALRVTYIICTTRLEY